MEQFLMLGYEMITVMIPAAAALALWLYRTKEEKRSDTKHLISCLIFSCYLFLLLHVTGAGTFYDTSRYGINLKMINLLPFSDTDIDIIGYLLNVVLFLPLGFMLPSMWTEFRTCKAVMLAGGAMSLVVELSQLINNRATDVDDLIMNTFGAILGFLVYKYIHEMLKREIPAETGMTAEMILMISATFLGRFFLFNEFGMAKYLYGF